MQHCNFSNKNRKPGCAAWGETSLISSGSKKDRSNLRKRDFVVDFLFQSGSCPRTEGSVFWREQPAFPGNAVAAVPVGAAVADQAGVWVHGSGLHGSTPGTRSSILKRMSRFISAFVIVRSTKTAKLTQWAAPSFYIKSFDFSRKLLKHNCFISLNGFKNKWNTWGIKMFAQERQMIDFVA